MQSPVLKPLKKILRWLVPGIIERRQSSRMRRHFKEVHYKRQVLLADKIYSGSDPFVLSGPFAGLVYINDVVWGPIEPKWIGCYEDQISSFFRDAIDNKNDVITDVGSAEGYYAVGLAKFIPTSQVHSFDVDPFARKQQKQMASANNCTNIKIGSFCSPQKLDRLLASSHSPLVICDIEGYEYQLMNPNQVPNLKKATLIIEVHDSATSDLKIKQGEAFLHEKFSKTHKIEAVEHRARDTRAYTSIPNLCKLSESELVEAMNEHRSQANQKWLYCVPFGGSN